ncbi:hypothetical protein Pmar_PMAR006968 [Perkinsus marinus ATCC 50983]|uniref:Uncharacterized protein n=1 Tax=Perkinsus marinus (strain ATCC 50983 / TXsc) TaxID=423536 RepID=C5KJX8_PERM5|nr:hypothetical protein Pmar_PMAR006968 [Perkinsus marinus ATCC 50983]EER15236.1 hypothetical protein Pmar_PMAR006968 [Perkinsus marinus ATCC 50983]|eukprot:XP_002783440.1 hypothetical protein Pmar_PMAR006968 [Perkinsus marinus ATCC 50983]
MSPGSSGTTKASLKEEAPLATPVKLTLPTLSGESCWSRTKGVTDGGVGGGSLQAEDDGPGSQSIPAALPRRGDEGMWFRVKGREGARSCMWSVLGRRTSYQMRIIRRRLEKAVLKPRGGGQEAIPEATEHQRCGSHVHSVLGRAGHGAERERLDCHREIAQLKSVSASPQRQQYLSRSWLSMNAPPPGIGHRRTGIAAGAMGMNGITFFFWEGHGYTTHVLGVYMTALSVIITTAEFLPFAVDTLIPWMPFLKHYGSRAVVYLLAAFLCMGEEMGFTSRCAGVLMFMGSAASFAFHRFYPGAMEHALRPGRVVGLDGSTDDGVAMGLIGENPCA